VTPASGAFLWAVTNFDSSEARNSTVPATSAGVYVGGIEVKIRPNLNVNVGGSQFDTYAAGVGVLGTRDPLDDGQQGGELVAGPGRIPRDPGVVDDVMAGCQGVGCSGP
jgi:hypothetical protein